MSMHRLRLSLVALLLAGCGLCMPAAHAATNCSATSTSVVFGTVSTSGMTDVAATFDVTCTTNAVLFGNTQVRMCLNIGEGSAGGGHVNPRRLLNGTGDALQFQLYIDAARTQIWGSLDNPAIPNPGHLDFDYQVPFLSSGSQTRQVTIYGRVPTQTLVAGDYASNFSGIQTSLRYRYNEGLFGATFPASCVSGGVQGPPGTFPFTVSARVPMSCHAYETTDLGFGSIPGLINADRDATSTLSLTCTGRTAWNVGLDNGLHASGSTRRMRLPATGNHVVYELYREPSRSSRWGTTIGTDTVPGVGNGSEQYLTVYGRVPAGQAVPAGNYSDTITVTITY